jgi:DME family drug/metabolite transporter
VDTTTQLLVAQRSVRWGYFSIALCALLWATVGIVMRLLYEMSDINPFSIGFFRLALAVPPLLIACWLSFGRDFLKIKGRDFLIMSLVGLMLALYQVCYAASIERVGVTIAVLVTLCTAPIMIAVLSWLVLGERPSKALIVALVGALAGTVLLIGFEPAESGSQSEMFWGVVLALGSALGYAVMTLCSRSLAGRYDPLHSTTIGFSAGAVMLLPFALLNGFITSYPVEGWMLLVYLGVVPSAMAYWLFFRAMHTTSATAAGIITLLEPLTSTLLAVWIFHEHLSETGIFGAILLLGSLLLLFLAPSREELQKQ